MRYVGIYYAYWAKDRDVDFFPYIGKVKTLGFDQLEINSGIVIHLSGEERQRLVDEAGIREIVLSYGTGLPRKYDVSSMDEGIRKAGVAFMRGMIEAVGTMGGGMMGGTIHSCWPAQLPEGAESKRPMLMQSLKSMKELVKVAEDNDVYLNVEVINRFEQFLLNTCEEAVEYVNEVDSPRCGILLDTFHMNIEEDSFSKAIKLAGPRLKALHLGESNRKPPRPGRMPWGEIRQALDEIDFKGPLIMEPFVRPGGIIGRNTAVWRDLMPGADLDVVAAQSVEFVRKELT